jgi:hypothetical protein
MLIASLPEHVFCEPGFANPGSPPRSTRRPAPGSVLQLPRKPAVLGVPSNRVADDPVSVGQERLQQGRCPQVATGD